MITGTFKHSVSLTKWAFFDVNKRENIQVVLRCPVPHLLVEFVIYTFELHVHEEKYYLNRFVSWTRRPFDRLVAEMMYPEPRGLLLTNLLEDPNAKPEDFPVPDTIGCNAGYIWQNFDALNNMFVLTGTWFMYPKEILDLLAQRDFLTMMCEKHIRFKPEYVLLFTHDANLAADVRLYNHLVDMTAQHGSVVTDEQMQGETFRETDNMTWKRMKKYIVSGPEIASLKYVVDQVTAFQAKWQNLVELYPLPPHPEYQTIVDNPISYFHCEQESTVDSFTKAITAVFPKLLVVCAAHRCPVNFRPVALEAPWRVVLIGNTKQMCIHAGAVYATCIAPRTWRPLPEPAMRIHSVPSKRGVHLFTETSVDARRALVIPFCKPDRDSRIRVLFVFAYDDEWERSHFDHGFASNMCNWICTMKTGKYKLHDVVQYKPKTDTTKGGFMHKGELASIDVEYFIPLYTCHVSLLPHLRHEDFDVVVFFGDSTTPAMHKHEAIRVGGRDGMTVFFGVSEI